ncbi:MAG TPA: oxygenase MpaB family protein [Solirubrobacteraceae bacterium]|nr:oxygenase MpaB family protein [Solirubrobacteraceae bacterium]
MTHIGYASAAARTVAVPHVARRIFREGTGDQIMHPWQRDADTLTFFGELMRRGHRSTEGVAACERIQQIHRAVGGVRNDDQIYTLSVMVSYAEHLAHAMGRSLYSDVEDRARFNFWLGVGRAMHVRNVPETKVELQAWTEEYEARSFEPSHEAHMIGEAHILAIEHRFPGPLIRWARSSTCSARSVATESTNPVSVSPLRSAAALRTRSWRSLTLILMRLWRAGWADPMVGVRGPRRVAEAAK